MDFYPPPEGICSAIRTKSRQVAVIQLCFFFLFLFSPKADAAPTEAPYGLRVFIPPPARNPSLANRAVSIIEAILTTSLMGYAPCEVEGATAG